MKKRFDITGLAPEHVATGAPMLDELGEIESVISLAVERARTLLRHSRENGEPVGDECKMLLGALRNARTLVQFETQPKEQKRGLAKPAMMLVDLLLEAAQQPASVGEEVAGNHVRDAIAIIHTHAPTVAQELLEQGNFEALVDAVNALRRGGARLAFLDAVCGVAWEADATTGRDVANFERQHRRHSKKRH